MLQYTAVGKAIGLSAIVIVLLLFSRATFCFPVLFSHNYFGTERVSWREMIVAWYDAIARCDAMQCDAMRCDAI